MNQPPNIKINPNDIELCVCTCGCDLFTLISRIGKISGLKIGQLTDQFMPVDQIMVCAQCGMDMRQSQEQRKIKDKEPDNKVVVGADQLVEIDQEPQTEVDNVEDSDEPEEPVSNVIIFNEFKKKV
jgi:hypothetical protein